MAPLPSELRSILERSVLAAREAAEEAARAALAALAVDRPEPFPILTQQQRQLRNRLRARARQLGGGVMANGLEPLVEEIAYGQWHRMLFARFLAENGLLVHPSGVAVTLEECEELAAEEGEPDGWMVAARYASAMLPGIFGAADPAAQLRFAPEGRQRLESILSDLPPAVFAADDSLGWVYQFWQSQRKKEVNARGDKIGGRDLAPVTQLFTEDYIVRFLLENSLGAWWAARHPDSPLLKRFEYLRFKEDGTPAAGTFPGWPEGAAEVTVMDPCCGSGHFLTVAFEMLRAMRMEVEGLSEAEAGDAVLRDNLFGLELDARCVQIAAFALAFTAWKSGGYRPLPPLNLACSGTPVTGQLEEWKKLANGDPDLSFALERLYNLFRNAPELGSLIDPANLPLKDRMFAVDYAKLEPLLARALAKERVRSDPVAELFGHTAEGVARATRLLAGNYTLVATNVPYLTRGKQSDALREYCGIQHPDGKADLATVFVERCRAFASSGGSYATVTPQNWLFLASYTRLRQRFLQEQQWNVVARLGPGAFETITGEVVSVVLSVLTSFTPSLDHRVVGLNAAPGKTPTQKARLLQMGGLLPLIQSRQLTNPDSKLVLGEVDTGHPLSQYATTFEGMHSGDYVRFGRKFWELAAVANGWTFQQAGPEHTKAYAGREHALLWEDGNGTLVRFVQERLGTETVTMWIKGADAWGKNGVAVSVMADLKATLYTGEVFTHGIVAIVPKRADDTSALWAFCQSAEFRESVRRLDQKVCVARATFDRVPFDLLHWQRVAESSGPLPEPYSDEPTQWLFKGHPAGSTDPLQVAVARLLGYRWPQQESDSLEAHADEDGIVCLPALAGELPAAERLRALLAAAYGAYWSPALQERLLAAVGFVGKGLEEWLRDGFFAQHCRLFHNRPFIWQIWDGRRDGFSALVNYHRLDGQNLNRLIYRYLGSWIEARRRDRDEGVAGAEGRLVAALDLQKKLEAIRDGEAPYDIYVRWKPLEKQPIGWEPDLNDGVRLNIRPFVTAGVLRSRFTIHWNKDRGKNPDGSERINDRHFTLKEKREARERTHSSSPGTTGQDR